jgi:DeoR family transcriptional regulator of aga operon
VVVVADSTKLGRHAFAQICPTATIDVLVTDSDAPQDMVRMLESEGVTVKTV